MTGAKNGWHVAMGREAGSPETSCVVVVLSCLQDSDGAGMALVLVGADLRWAAGEAGWKYAEIQ